jgi:tRNA/tmRNA/rRNA uracil-C5-methylase (TrmA/RlmC/RlmD family)
MLELHITDISPQGQGIGQHRGRPVYVPYTLPGERVSARFSPDAPKEGPLLAQGVKLLEASADRVLPRCAHFTRCAGCQWQHMSYEAQLALKTDILATQLEKMAGFELAALAIPSPAQWAYRQEAQFYPLPAGGLGFLASDHLGPTPIQDCHIISPALLALRDQLEIDLPSLKQITLRDNGRGDLMLILSTHDDEAPELELDIQVSVNFLLSDNEPANLIGSTHLDYAVLGRDYRVTAGVFWRPQTPQIAALGEKLVAWADLDGGEAVLELYGGAGVWSGVLAPSLGAGHLLCADSYPPAVFDAGQNLAAFPQAEAIEAAAAQVLAGLDRAYDLLILDPPPRGLDEQTLVALGQALPPRILYISSEPISLARDAKALQKTYGYRLKRVQAFDFEPQTFRLVSLAEFQRTSPRR